MEGASFMPVAILIEMPGMTEQIYEAVNEKLGFPGTVREGLLSHLAGPVEGGVQVVDVWESRAAFDDFALNLLRPALAQVEGGDRVGRPTIRDFPIHNTFRR
jgi:hypothetical protein